MNLSDLRFIIDLFDIPPYAYSIGTDQDLSVCIVEEAYRGEWRVYYTERGRKSLERSFDSEDEAIRHLLEMVVNDHTVIDYICKKKSRI